MFSNDIDISVKLQELKKSVAHSFVVNGCAPFMYVRQLLNTDPITPKFVASYMHKIFQSTNSLVPDCVEHLEASLQFNFVSSLWFEFLSITQINVKYIDVFRSSILH